MTVPFEEWDRDTQYFYNRIIANVMLNCHAVRMGYFDTLLCETDDPRVSARWDAALPKLASVMRQRAKDDLEDGV
jgi:hypothetical protein